MNEQELQDLLREIKKKQKAKGSDSTDSQGLEGLLNGIKKSLKRHQKQNDSHIDTPLEGSTHPTKKYNYQSPHHQINISTYHYGQGYLKSVLLPLSQTQSVVYIDNLLGIIIGQRRDSIEGLLIYTSHDGLDNYQLCEQVAQTILSSREQFPENYGTALSKKERSIGWSLISLPFMINKLFEISSKESTLPEGKKTIERAKIYLKAK